MSNPSLRRALPSLLGLGVLLVPLPSQTRATSPFAEYPPALSPDRLPGAKAVRLDDCKEWLYTLASPEFEGRQTGHPGFRKAAEYVSAHFARLGLEARGENGTYYQTVPWSATRIDPDASYVSFSKNGEEFLRIPAKRLTGRAGADFSAEGEVALLVVEPPPRPEKTEGRRRFVMPTIEGLDEVDVKGKIVVAFVHPTDDSISGALTRFALRRSLQRKDIAGLVFAQREAPTGGLRGGTRSRRSTSPAAAGRRHRPGETTFGGEDLTELLRAAGLEDRVLDGGELAPRVRGISAHVEVRTEETEAPAMNVWAVLPGSDPDLADEYVVIGSHLDHIGMRGGLHPGADDDGSGTTGVMAIAKMFTENPTKPRRSILFVCFCGEEDGLIGSAWFARNPPVPLSSIVAELQMDMIGRDEEANRESRTPEERSEKAEDNRKSLHLVGTRRLAPSLHELCLKKNETAGFDLEYDQEGMFGRSDHANFARMGVPVAFFFTGLHRDYHETTDTPDKIHFEKLLRVATYVYDIAFDLALQDGRPEVDPALWEKMRGRRSEEPAAPLSGAAGK